MKNTRINIINRKSKFEYEFIDSYISGIQLYGSEVKAIKDSKVTMVDSFCYFNNNELILKNLNITSDMKGYSHLPLRDRKLLLNKSEIKKLKKDLVDGLTIIPYRIFINEKHLIKVEIVLAKGKKTYDKRETIKKRDIEREIKNIK